MIDRIKHPKRSQSSYLNLSRHYSDNHFRTEKAKSGTTVAAPEFKPSDFFSSKIVSWFVNYVKSRFGPDHPYLEYKGEDTGVYQLSKSPDSGKDYISLAVVGDWGTDTPESDAIAQKIGGHAPDYTIHIGDTYFVGAPHEIEINFTDPDSAWEKWAKGKVGSFCLLGNHEMYARGDAFFDELLPTVGIKNADGKYDAQNAAFFCLENEHWRVLGLDTGYHSIGKIPLLEMTSLFAPNSHFDKRMMKWLKDVVKLDDPTDKRGLLILTHNQYITAFKEESEYQTPASQLASLIGTQRPILWLWGHEHKFSMYEKAQVKDGVTAYGRCIGHGGMPIEIEQFAKLETRHGYSKLVMVDDRKQHNPKSICVDSKDKKIPALGYNGYAVVKIKEEQLCIEYYDIHQHLYNETWTANNNGDISGTISVDSACPLSRVPGKEWADAVK